MKASDGTEIPYRASVRLEEDGPEYTLRFHGDRAVFTRRREDGTVELIIRPEHTQVFPVCRADPNVPLGDLLPKPDPQT
jgi:hypothetical protein